MLKWIDYSCFFVLLAIISTHAYATGTSDSGFYLGFMTGPTTSGNSANNSSSSSNSFGARFLLGYETNPFFSYEAGLSTYPQIQSGNTNSSCTSSNQRNLYLDVLLKGSLPITSGVGIFSKVGVATPIYLPFLNSCKESNNNMAKFYPDISLGSYFNLSDGLIADLSWNRLITGGSTKNIDLYAIGISYHFNVLT